MSISTRFGTEPYLSALKNIKFRIAISKLRTSSHALAIERDRYTNPKTPVHEKLFPSCQKIEDECHFVMECKTNCDFREMFLNKLKDGNRNFAAISQRNTFVYIFTKEDNMSLWLRVSTLSYYHHHELLSIVYGQVVKQWYALYVSLYSCYQLCGYSWQNDDFDRDKFPSKRKLASGQWFRILVDIMVKFWKIYDWLLSDIWLCDRSVPC